MKNKKADTLEAAVSQIPDGATLLVGGFGQPGVPEVLIDGVCDLKRRDLTIVTNNAGTGHSGIARLIEEGCVSKLICSFPWAKESFVFKQMFDMGKIALEIVPQGTLAERMRTAGAGLGGFLTPTGVGTDLAEGKETITVDGKEYVLEKPLAGDYALIKAYRTDPRGNLVYRKTARNFNPIMAMAAAHTIVEVAEDVAIDVLDPEVIVTPGVFVDTYYVTGWYEIGKERNPS
ncbi:MAG: 3-oxoadipate CoA-transferase [Rhodospirillaceae bacterium]|nr:3-oxoadipate CoA-transferase [Rhodospirillaceae bacterium]|tara:strand:- start:115 stop:810 length:696 start_codon:yes stop_codon:yes gene_type:complete